MGELHDYAPFRLLLRGPLVGFALWPVEGDLVAPSPAVVRGEAEDGVLFRVLHVLHVRRHVCDVNGVLLLPFLCRGARRGGGRVPVESLPCDVWQVALEGCPLLVGALAGLLGGWWRRRALNRCAQSARSRGGGCWGMFCGEPAWSGSAGSFANGSDSGGVQSPCRYTSSVCWTP